MYLLVSELYSTHGTFENRHHQFSQHSSKIVLDIHRTTSQLILNKPVSGAAS